MSSRLSLPTYTYLYGFTQEQIVSLASIQYEAALHIKVNAAKELLSRLLHKPFQAQDSTRINDVARAKEFNLELLKELKI